MNQGYQCLECFEKDEYIKKLQDENEALKREIEEYRLKYQNELPPLIPLTPQISYQDPPLEPAHSYQEQKPPQVIPLKQSKTQEQEHEPEPTLQIGERFFEQFMIIGPDYNELNNQPAHIRECDVNPSVLYEFRPDPFNQVPADYAFPKLIKAKRLKVEQREVQELSTIVLRTLQQSKGEDEYVAVISREDVMKSLREQKPVSIFVQTTNLNIFRYLICFEITDFYCRDPKSSQCWICPIVFVFISYIPFITFFHKKSAEFWNSIKGERVKLYVEGIDDIEKILALDLQFVIKKLQVLVANTLFTLRSKQVQFETKYAIGDTSIKTPNEDEARFSQGLWGSSSVFTLLSLPELCTIVTHLALCQRLIFFSVSKAKLSHILLTLNSLISPFQYTQPFNILMPVKLLENVGAPTSYCFGIHGSLNQYQEQILEFQKHDLTMIDLDEMRMVLSSEQSRPNIEELVIPIEKNRHYVYQYSQLNPSKENRLISKKKQHLHTSAKPKNYVSAEEPKALKKSILRNFYEFWRSIVKTVPIDRKFLQVRQNSTQVDLHLIQEAMLRKAASEQKKFLYEFVQQPIFTAFLDQAYDNYIKTNT